MNRSVVIALLICLLLPLAAASARSHDMGSAFSVAAENAQPEPMRIARAALQLQRAAQERANPPVEALAAWGGAVIAALVLLIYLLAMNYRKLKASQKELANFNALRKTFIDADDSLIYLKDENLKYVFVNRAFEEFFGSAANGVIGRDDYALSEDAFAHERRRTDLAVLEGQTLIVDEVRWQDRIFKTTKFPVRMINGAFGVGAYIKDITDERAHEKRREKMLQRNRILVDVLGQSFQNRQEQLDYVLNRSLELTESRYGYIFLYDEERREFTSYSWTEGVMDECAVAEQQSIYRLDDTGIWGEAVRQKKPIVINDFQGESALKKGYPQGHVALNRFMTVPVVIDGKIVAVVGLANKESDYDDNDVYEMTLLMGGIWNSVERRAAQERLIYERNKYLQTLISIGDGVMVVGSDGMIEMLNTVAQRLTGWTLDEARGRHYKDVFALSHEQEGLTIGDPVQGVFATDRIQELGNHAMLTSRDGAKYFLEDSAAPIKDDAGATVGVVLVFRDVTDKKEQHKRIEYLSFHDSLTGLYNRRFFEEEMYRLDEAKNLPLSIIVGDIDGLKLTNDIYEHAFGDMLLEKVAEVLQSACRPEDIIARWGGDEFVVLLKNADRERTEEIVNRIKADFAKEQIQAIKGNISMGFGTKTDPVQDIAQVLVDAEQMMYLVKTLERDAVRSDAIASIITALHENSVREEEHSARVSELCQELGRAMNLPEVDIRKLKEAGYLHDIGKIVLDPKLLDKNYRLTNQEWNEMKRHATVGYRILHSFDDTLDLAESVLAHHEWWNGGGYPKGIAGEEIPLLARIISIVESYDRMIHDSPNTTAMSEADAIHVIRQGAARQFDPHIAEIFARIMESKRSGGASGL